MPIENGIITKSLEAAQKKVEGNNFDLRKHLVEFDDVVSKQREIIYKKRNQVLKLAEGEKVDDYESTKDMILEMAKNEIANFAGFHLANLDENGQPDFKEILEITETLIPLSAEDKDKIKSFGKATELTDFIFNLIKVRYEQTELDVKEIEGLKNHPAPLRGIEKSLLLNVIDRFWVEHLENLDYLRTGIGLRGYGQRDPLVEFKRESFQLFKSLLNTIQNQVVFSIFKVGKAATIALSPMARANLQFHGANKTAVDSKSNLQRLAGQSDKRRTGSEKQISSKLKNDFGEKIGRNDPCPCGSGKKFKRCHGE